MVVVVYNMAREAPRTLYSLSAAYQRNIKADDYEVIVVDNGSNPPFDSQVLDNLSGNFRLLRIDPAPPSPARAINRGISEAQGEVIGVLIDGARLVTPGLLSFAKDGAALHDCAVVSTTSWFLGFDDQRWARQTGYTKEREDALLESIHWKADGYRLFEIATPANSSINSWLPPMNESNALFLRREHWDALKGFDERFDLPGGGLVNLDTFNRALELPKSELVVLLGEGSFHQIHGGIATNSVIDEFGERIEAWKKQYEEIRNEPWSPPPEKTPIYLGTLPQSALAHLTRSAVASVSAANTQGRGSFKLAQWYPAEARAADVVLAALVDLAEAEFQADRFDSAAAVARLALNRNPDATAAQRLLAHASPYLRTKVTPNVCGAEVHLALGHAYSIMGDASSSANEYRKALSYDDDLVAAHVGLSQLRFPGENYITWLERFHQAMSPQSYLEIGVARGLSLAFAEPPTIAVGVDPEPKIDTPLKTEAHLFAESSDVFFAQRRLEKLLNSQPLSLAFIDGLHAFQQSLRDFINVESWCGPHSVILMHDTVPLDEPTQRPVREKKFYTGDVWKTVLCLKHYRPELEVFTIATPPSGLTVVLGLDSKSTTLNDKFDEATQRFGETTFASVESVLDSMLNVVPNEWAAVEDRLKARGIV